MSDSARPHGLQPTRLLCPWDSPGKSTGVGCHCLLRASVLLLLLLSRFSRVRLCATPWTAAHQAPPSLGFSRQECWSGVLLPSLPVSSSGGVFFVPERLYFHLSENAGLFLLNSFCFCNSEKVFISLYFWEELFSAWFQILVSGSAPHPVQHLHNLFTCF